ncbi:glycosyltransferase family 4 protein [Luteolibacter soli]|uniref:Glycosyltransferase n=1 Tax=Luteolibacter soli TaxID=3135280 RepID=A0ABU9ATH7_9BACT
MSSTRSRIAVACPIRSVCDHHAKVFGEQGRLQGHYLGTRRGADGIPKSLTHLLPLVGAISYAVARPFPNYGEAAKVACFPLFDAWAKHRIPAGTAVLSSYGYAVECFRKARATGAFTLLDGGNSHFSHYWKVVSDEHARWGCDLPPFPRAWYERGLRSLEVTDWVFSPSSYVTRSFIEEGFSPDRVLHLPYPVHLGHFSSEPQNKLPASPLRVICTGGVSLRKGFPYLLEALRLIRKERDAILMLTDSVHPSMRSVLAKYSDVPIDWAPMLPHTELAARLKSAHVFALLSVEEGLARTALEAIACGVPAVLTPNTGASDFIEAGVNGEIVPIRDAVAAAEAIVKCHERRNANGITVIEGLAENLSFDRFRERLLGHLATIDLAHS